MLYWLLQDQWNTSFCVGDSQQEKCPLCINITGFLISHFSHIKPLRSLFISTWFTDGFDVPLWWFNLIVMIHLLAAFTRAAIVAIEMSPGEKKLKNQRERSERKWNSLREAAYLMLDLIMEIEQRGVSLLYWPLHWRCSFQKITWSLAGIGGLLSAMISTLSRSDTELITTALIILRCNPPLPAILNLFFWSCSFLGLFHNVALTQRHCSKHCKSFSNALNPPENFRKWV